MTKGGARARSGPSPDPSALRRNRGDDRASWTDLPDGGRPGEPPAWPFTAPSDRESELWAEFWAKPQALIWERDHLCELVALFVRQLVEAEDPKSSAENRKTVRMMFADLYLTPDSMARARIRIVSADEPRQRPEPGRRSSARDRLRVVDGAGA